MKPDEIEKEKEARDLIDKMHSKFTLPLWVFAILILGGIVGPIGGLIDFILNFEQEQTILDFIAALFLMVLLTLTLHVTFICCKTTYFDGKGVSVKPFFGELAFYDWSTFDTVYSRYYGAILKFSDRTTIKVNEGSQFYIDLITATQIWQNRNYIEE